MKSGLKLLVVSVVSGLVSSVGYMTAGVSDDTVALAGTKASPCEFSGGSPSGVSVDCYRQVAIAYGVSTVSMAQIFAGMHR